MTGTMASVRMECLLDQLSSIRIGFFFSDGNSCLNRIHLVQLYISYVPNVLEKIEYK